MWQYPLGPLLHQLLRNISLLGRWSTSCSDRCIAHFFMATRNTIKGVGGENKEQTNNMSSGLLKVQEEELCYIAFPMSICRLTLAWIFSDNSTTHDERWLILTGLPSLQLDPISSDWSLYCPVSTGHSRHPSPTAFSWVPLSNPLTHVPLLSSGHVEIAGSGLCLVSRQNRQRIVCLADNLHSVTIVLNLLSLVKGSKKGFPYTYKILSGTRFG